MKNILITLGFCLFSTQVISSDLVIDKEGLNQENYYYDLNQCEEIVKQGQAVQPEPEKKSKRLVKSTGKAAAVGAGAAAIAGGSGSDGAKVGAAVGFVSSAVGGSRKEKEAQAKQAAEIDKIMRNCMTGRGYTILN